MGLVIPDPNFRELPFVQVAASGTKIPRLDEIERAEIKIATKDKSGPIYRRILWPDSFIEKKSIFINTKVFGEEDLKICASSTSITWERTPHPVRRPAFSSHLISTVRDS